MPGTPRRPDTSRFDPSSSTHFARRFFLLFVRPTAVFSTMLLAFVMVACGGGSSGGGSGTGGSSSGSGGPWQQVSLPSGVTQPNHIAFNSSGHWFIADTSSGFYRSTDQGATWTQINSGMATTFGWTITVDSANGDLIAAIFSGTLNANPVNFYRSSDEGNTWTLIPTGHLSLIPAMTGCVVAANANLVCGGYWAPSPASGAWVSSNGGQTTVSASASPLTGGGVFGLAFNPAAQDLWMGTDNKESTAPPTMASIGSKHRLPTSKLILCMESATVTSTV